MNTRNEEISCCDIGAINARARSWAEPGLTVHPVQIDEIVVADDALDALIDAVRTVAGAGRTLLVVDHTPMTRKGIDLKPLIEEKLAAVTRLSVRCVPDDPTVPFHVEIEIVDRLAEELADFAAVVAVGSGSITDAVKYARHRAAPKSGRAIQFISFPTAASVTAYTSGLAALNVKGVKRTLPADPPDVIVCDLRTLADAPRIMTQAGFADVLARSVACGDWFLATQLGMDDGFSEVPTRLLEAAEREMIARAEGVATGDLDAVRAVTEANLLAGMAMSLMNRTTPLSGWEHTISHFLDLSAARDGRPLALHGGQVGVGTLVAARAYERAWHELDFERLALDGDDDEYRDRIQDTFRGYDATGKLSFEVWRDFRRKLDRWHRAIDTRREFVERCRGGEIEALLQRVVRPLREIDDALHRAGAPRRFADLDEPIDRSSARAAVVSGHLLRARFTFGDLLAEAGWWRERTADELLDEFY